MLKSVTNQGNNCKCQHSNDPEVESAETSATTVSNIRLGDRELQCK